MLVDIKRYVEHNKDSITRPPMTCYKPLRVYNKYLDDVLYVPCRKCPACLHNHGVELTNKVAKECKQHAYSLFFTLTFDNEHLPVMKYDHGTIFKGSRPYAYDKNKGEFLYPEIDVSEIEDFDLPSLNPQHDLRYDCFGYCNKYDIQLFLKRLRVNLQRGNVPYKHTHGKTRYIKDSQLTKLCKNEKKIRYFICSEYGPSTFRPHYHGILWTDNKYVA